METLLISQAQVLNVIFVEMSRRAALNMGEHLTAMDIYMRLALRAQNQCRTTLATLAEIKNPQPVAFVKQANIGYNQQVNNGEQAPRAEENKNRPNELLEESHEQRMDTGTPRTSSATNPAMETVGAVKRTKDERGKKGK